MGRFRFLLLPAALAVAFACSHSRSAEPATERSAPPSAVLDQVFAIGRGQTVAIEGEGLQVTFTGVAPRVDGGGEISLEMASAGAESVVAKLGADPGLEPSAAHLGYRVTLIELQPPAAAPSETDRGDYVATLVVARAGVPAAEAAAVASGQPFTLKLGESVRVAGGLELKFVSVLSDSRCPLGVDCVWEGNAEIGVEASLTGEPPTLLKLNTHRGSPTEATHRGYTIRLLGLDPYPRYEDQGAARRYAASLVVAVESPDS